MNLKQIDLRLLRSFLAVSRSQNFVKASESLNITQSALSQQMKELASHLDMPLFEKKGRRLVLTNFGNGLLQKVEPLLGQIEEALLQSVNDNQNIVGTLRVGATNTYSKIIALPSCMTLLKANPSLNIELQELPAEKVLSGLMEGAIDIAILPEDYQFADLNWVSLITEQFSVIGDPRVIERLPRNLTLKTLVAYDLVALNRQFLIRQKIDAQARMEGILLNFRMETSTMGDLLEIAKSGEFLALGSPIAIAKDRKLSSRKIKGDLLTRTAAVCWRKTKFVTNAMIAFQENAIMISSTIQSDMKKRKGPA
jgi:LysR family cyn operon transcriptional activator